jgi:hypothetical protein
MKPGILAVASLLAVTSGALSHGQTPAPVVVTGEVVRYEPGRVLVLKADGRVVTYNLTSDIVVPAEVQLGRNVSVHSERGTDGATTVTRITTTSVNPMGQVERTTEETRVGATEVRRKTTTVTGEVVSFVPGRTIVIREGGRDVPLTLSTSASVPADVKVGQRVTLHTEPGPDGSTSVSRIVTTSVTPEGQMKRTVEETRTQPTGETTKTTTTTVQGRVESYSPGRSITVARPDGSRTTYTIGSSVQLPAEVAVGKAVTIRTLPDGSVETVVVERQ